MDTLEQITLSNTVLEEELQFLSFVCQNPDVQIRWNETAGAVTGGQVDLQEATALHVRQQPR